MLALALAMTLIQSAPAQQAPDWLSASDQGTVAAVLLYDTGLSVIVLCREERLETRIGGLPASTSNIRFLEINVPGSELRKSTWVVGADQTTALTRAPGVYARRLRQGGRLTVRVPAEGESRAIRYELPLPEAHEPLDAVLTACGTALERAEDADFEPESPMMTWTVYPIPQLPPEAVGLEARIRLSCLLEVGGALSDCSIVEESPRLHGIGRAALQAARRARVARVDDEEITESRRVAFNIHIRSPP